MSTYEKIVELCRKSGISVTGLESELGFGRGSIGKLKKNNGTTSLQRLQKIADYFNIDVKYFLDDNDGVQQDVQESQYYVDQKTLELAEELFRNRELHVLMDAAKDVDRESLAILYSLLLKMKKTNDE